MKNRAAILLILVCCLSPALRANAAPKTFTGVVSSNWFNGDNWNPTGVPGASDDVVVSSGTLDLSGGNATVATYTHENGTLTGSGTLTVTGLMTWARGVIRGTGVVDANGGIAITTLSAVTLADTRTLNNSAMATWTGPGGFSLGGNATFTNLPGATFAIQTASNMGSGMFDNMGTVTKTAGGGDGVTNISSFINNSGTINVLSGTLRVSSSGMHTGTLTVQAGATFDFTGGDHMVSGSFTSADSIGFNGGQITFKSGSTYNVGEQTVVTASAVTFENGAHVSLSDTLRIEGGALNLSSGTDFMLATYTHNNGTLTGTDDLSVSGPMTWARGVIRGTGVVNANGGIAITTLSAVTLADTRTLNNSAMATWTGPGASPSEATPRSPTCQARPSPSRPRPTWARACSTIWVRSPRRRAAAMASPTSAAPSSTADSFRSSPAVWCAAAVTRRRRELHA